MSFAGIIREAIAPLKGTTRTVFLCILVECNHSDNPNFLFNNKPCPLKRGDWVTSRKNIEDLTGLSEQQVKTSLKNLKNLTILLTNNLTNHGSKLTVVNIDKYLHKSEPLTNQLTNDLTNGSPTGNQRVTINKKDNNKKNENKRAHVREEDFNIFLAYFEKCVGHPLSDVARNDAQGKWNEIASTKQFTVDRVMELLDNRIAETGIMRSAKNFLHQERIRL